MWRVRAIWGNHAAIIIVTPIIESYLRVATLVALVEFQSIIWRGMHGDIASTK